MEEKLYYSVLFDIYGELLTLKQQNYFKDYYFEYQRLDSDFVVPVKKGDNYFIVASRTINGIVYDEYILKFSLR